ncbi:F-box protein [Striga hermonthica]|uniref:F-box protein n=1 Tax=Striga hermonthica TaxID=68872 RepID=A0A9N7R7R2_STRHE|nr:F-box protein [Striga hermonthica]
MALQSFGDINALPEGCIANVLSLTSPKDACRLSAVVSTFGSASRSDVVWGRFLPSDYREVIAAVNDPDVLLSQFRSKMDLYLYLSDHPILIDGSRKSFSLEKSSGKKCYMIAARDLIIIWGDTPRYWRWIPLPESRFPEVAELLTVCRFEIRGKISTKMLSPGTCYVAYLVFTLRAETTGLFRAETNGLHNNPAEVFVELTGHERVKSWVFIDSDRSYQRMVEIAADVNANDIRQPTPRGDGWMEVKLGEYFVEGGEHADLEFGVLRMRHGYWKRGFICQGIEVRPKAAALPSSSGLASRIRTFILRERGRYKRGPYGSRRNPIDSYATVNQLEGKATY